MNFFEKFNPNIFNKNLGSSQRYTAFTLAEVLITLAIIGVVAALTIPTLVQKADEKATVSQLKKEYSIISSAYNLAVQDNGTPDAWNLIGNASGPGAVNMLNTLAPYLKIIQNCGTGTGCFSNTYYHLNGTILSTTFDSINFIAKAKLADGTLMFTQVDNENCAKSLGDSVALQHVCGAAIFDINGDKKPNKVGVDTFYFHITKYGVIPFGSDEENINGYLFDKTCKDLSADSTEGWGCTAWVLYNENMDYLHCSDLSWSGKHSCS